MKIPQKKFNIWKDFGCLHSIGLYTILCIIFYNSNGLEFWGEYVEWSILLVFGIPLSLFGISYYNTQLRPYNLKQLRAQFTKEIKNKASEKIFKELIERDASGKLSDIEIEEKVRIYSYLVQ